MVTAPRTFTTTAVASRDSLAHRPQELATVIAAEKRNLEAQIAAAGMRRIGPWRLAYMWAVGDDSTTPHGWKRAPGGLRKNASARVVRITATATDVAK